MSRVERGGAGGRRPGHRVRVWAWSAAALVLLLPLVAMQFTDEVNWTLSDFIFAGALMLGVGIPMELAVRRRADRAYRAAVGVALAAAFLLVWLNAAVGIIGSEDNPANWLFGGVLAIAILGAIFARGRPSGMARVLVATALAQASVALIAVVAGLGLPYSGALELIALNGIFVALWLTSAWLFQKAARTPS